MAEIKTRFCDAVYLLNTLEQAERVHTKLQLRDASNLEKCEDDFKAQDLENSKKVKELTEAEIEQGTWSIVKRVITYVSAAASIVFGVTLATIPGQNIYLAGGMICAGALLIVNLIAEDTGLWKKCSKSLTDDPETQRQLAFWMPTALGIAGTVLNIFCSWHALSAIHGLSWAVTGVEIAKFTADTAVGVATIGDGVSRSRVIQKHSEVTLSRKEFDVLEFRLKDETRHLKKHGALHTEIEDEAIEFMRTARAVPIMV